MKLQLKLDSDKDKANAKPKSTNLREKIRKSRTRRWFSFVLALFISAILWLLTALNDSSNSYVELTIPIRYANLTNEYAFEKNPPREIHVQLEARGYDLLRYTFSPYGDTITHFVTSDDIRNRRFEVSESLMMERVRQSVGAGSRIRWVSPSSISIPFFRRSRKRVLIESHIKAEAESGYLLHPISFEPSFIEIYGTPSQLKRINKITTDALSLEGLNESTTVKVALVAPEGIALSKDSLLVKVEVEELTQETFDVPIKVLNVPESIEFLPIPSSIKVQIIIPASAYKRYRSEDFTPVVDYNDIGQDEKGDLRKLLNVELLQVPPMVHRYKIEPSRVEYFLKEN